jgi:hypothetical protein
MGVVSQVNRRPERRQECWRARLPAAPRVGGEQFEPLPERPIEDHLSDRGGGRCPEGVRRARTDLRITLRKKIGAGTRRMPRPI